MFSLLRRSRSRKTRKESEEHHCYAPSERQQGETTTKVTERYRRLPERAPYAHEEDYDESAAEPALPTVTRPPVVITRKKYMRAAIEELDDLKDLDDNDDVDNDEADENDEDVGQPERRANKTSKYFHRDRNEYSGVNGDREKEKVNLAKTAASTATKTAPRRNKVRAFSKLDVDGINNTQRCGDSEEDADGNGAGECEPAAATTSSYEEAEWQGHVSAIGSGGNCRIIDKKYSDDNDSGNCTATSRSSSSTTRFNCGEPANNAERHYITTCSDKQTRATPTTAATATTSNDHGSTTVINEPEVKYRNLGNSGQHTKQRQSKRLSLTLGLGKSTRNDEATRDNNDNNGNINSKSVKSTHGRKSFFSSTKRQPDKAEVEAGTRQPETAERKVRALQKGKEFLSDIFMARGRNHNRNRNQHNQQPHTVQTQQQPQQQQQLSHLQQLKQVPNSYVISHNSGDNNRNNGNPAAMSINHNGNNVQTHLETISDPASISTNSYQITMSNNSAKNSASPPVNTRAHERQQRSNSAEHTHSVRREPHEVDARWRALSAERGRSVAQSAGVDRLLLTATVPVLVNGFCAADVDTESLNKRVDAERTFIHATGIELNGVGTEETQVNRRQVDEKQHGITSAPSETVNDVSRDDDSASGKASKRQLNELTECDRDSLLHSAAAKTTTATTVTTNERDACALTSSSSAMGQANAKAEITPATTTANSSRSSTPREFRESVITEERAASADKERAPLLPKITVADYSATVNGTVESDSADSSPVEQEVFYDFENVRHDSRNSGVNITSVDDEEHNAIDQGIEDDDVFIDQIPTTVYQNKWNPLTQVRHTKLENVPEQEEDDEASEEEEDEEDDDDDNEEADKVVERHNLDHESVERRDKNYDSRERTPLKSTNTSDSNLSTSFPDSGIGVDSPLHSQHSSKYGGLEDATLTANTKCASPLRQPPHNMPFVRDGNSTDCDETLMQCDDLDYVSEEVDAAHSNERLVCIESISLPDVVVESTTATSAASNTVSSSLHGTGEREIININGATGNSMGNVHFIPINVEGESGGGASNNNNNSNITQKRRSVDDSVIGSGGKKTSFAHMNGHQMKPTIEIIEDASESIASRLKGFKDDFATEKLKQELSEQKSRFSVQLEDAHKNVHNLQAKVGEMQTKIDKLEQELSTKAWNVERLQGELKAAQQDDEFVRKKLKILEDEKTNLRHKYSDNEEEFKRKYEKLEEQYKELEEKYKVTQALASNLQTQLATAQSEAEEWRVEVTKIRAELEEQIRILKAALENSEAERKICQDKWQKEFEMLRTQNMEREETLMTDCEWQMRQMQKQCKDKLDKGKHEHKETLEKAEALECELEERRQEVDSLKVYQAEVKSLRGVVTEQESSIKSLMLQIENLKMDLMAANENLEEQIKAVKKIKYQCDNAICDKEREVMYRIDEVRNQAASFWEDKLYTEMTRLKNELESVFVDERREALDKLQGEHIEELRALTTRYTANEEELRIEFNELQERYDRKNEEFLELREKSDNTLLQTRMHLDRADRDYQKAMCMEEERRTALEESLRKEFEAEKEEMEEKFRERLSQVKEEFAKELQNTAQDLQGRHKKELDRQRAKLQAERDEALQDLADRHRKKMDAAEEQIKDIELRQQRDLTDLKAAYDTEKAALDKRDMSNAQEIEQLHRKCRCLTNLFEEMRMRYERRDPRPEDLREIAELRSRCESQERDLYLLTDRLREMQIQMSELQQNGDDASRKNGKPIKKPPPKTIPTNCDVIYEENEERDSPPPPLSATTTTTATTNKHTAAPANNNAEIEEEDDDEEADEEAEEDEEDEEEDEEEQEKVAEIKNNAKNNAKDIVKLNNITNEDESHMITAV